MNLKSKLAYMALGGVLVLAGHVLPGLVVGSATAQSGLQDAEFNDLTVRNLTVVDKETGKRTVVLGQLSYNFREVQRLREGTGLGLLRISGNFIDFRNGDGEVTMSLNNELEGPYGLDPGITVRRDGEEAVSIDATSRGGSVQVHALDGTTVAEITATTRKGGMAVVYQPDGAIAAGLLTQVDDDGTSLGGGIEVYAPTEWDTVPRSVFSVGADEYGGTLGIGGKGSTKSRVQLGVNEYGSGVVNTWDKNDYRIK